VGAGVSAVGSGDGVKVGVGMGTGHWGPLWAWAGIPALSHVATARQITKRQHLAISIS